VDEINIVDPSVILGFGKGVPEIATKLNITLRGDRPKEYCRPRPESPFKIAHYTDDQGRVLIPAPHFNYIGTTIKGYDWWDESPPGKSFYAAIRDITNQSLPTLL
jgi:hypothetical protein